MTKGVITVPEWLFDKINDSAKNYHVMLVGEYNDGMLDHTKLRVNEVLAETDKAYKVSLDAETFSGNFKEWSAWLPKSVLA